MEFHFLRGGLVISKAPLKAEGIESDQSCSLEILLRPAGIKSISLYTILDIYSPDRPSQFLLQQWRDDLSVSRDFVDPRNRAKTADFYVEHVFEQGKLLLVTMTSGPLGTFVYLDGSRMQVFSTFTISQSDCTGQIVMGTSDMDYRPWSGEVRGLAIYSRALAPEEVLRHYRDWTDGRGAESPDLQGAMARYAFAERAGREIHNAVVSGPDLEIPKGFAVPHKAFLESPRKEFIENWGYAHDVLVNIVGFVPLGFLICAYWACTRSPRQAILYTILAGGILSFVIEVLQAYIPQRGSGITDIISNTMGAALGAVLARPGIVGTILGKTRLVPSRGNSVSRD